MDSSDHFQEELAHRLVTAEDFHHLEMEAVVLIRHHQGVMDHQG